MDQSKTWLNGWVTWQTKMENMRDAKSQEMGKALSSALATRTGFCVL